jgi:hypothetical protein
MNEFGNVQLEVQFGFRFGMGAQCWCDSDSG